jgi:hypothetical protein
MLNWRRDPAAEQLKSELRSERRIELESRAIERQIERKQLKSELEQLEREHALLDWIESEIDLIEADLPSSSTPPPTIAANSSDC